VRAKRVADDRIQYHMALAREAGLSYALGRAVCLESRIQNNGRGLFYNYSGPKRTPDQEALGVLRSIRVATAKRWWIHYKAGGSTRALCYTREQKNALRRLRDAAHRAVYGK